MNKHFHFLGICGTAMGAVAAAMARRGYTVTGSDANVYPPMSTFLEQEGITLFEGYRASNIPAEADVIVIGNAMEPRQRGSGSRAPAPPALPFPAGNDEGILPARQAQLRSDRTHGKTTTTSMLAWLMEDSGMTPAS